MSRPIAPVLFVSREPVTRERNGSTTAVGNLLALLRSHGVPVTVLITSAAGRSPRVWFRSLFDLPGGCVLRVPGYLRCGPWFVRPWSPLAWARLLARVARRTRGLRWVERALAAVAGGRLFTNAWDLTEPTDRECALVRREIARVRPGTVLANYAFWGALLQEVRGVHRAIVMHDVLADHVRLFREAGLPLDCNDVSPEMEARWLNGAETLIAVQRAEADAVRPRVRGTVLVQPVTLPAGAASAHPEANHCLLVASNSTPNVQGLRWLLEDVWPLVLLREPAATLAVAGTVRDRWSGPVPPGVTLLGLVESLADEHARAAVCPVPLLVGSGLKIKLLDALSYGKATVATSIGVQGMEDWAEGVVAVADTPLEFAEAVCDLLQNDSLRRERERAATALVRAHFSAGSAEEQALLRRLVRCGEEAVAVEREG